jgi:thioredoxin reductase
MKDVVIVGGGPAGLAAALVLGRAMKHATLFDAGEPRNAASDHVHGYFGRDATPPAELRAIGRAELARYPTIEIRDEPVTKIVSAQHPDSHGPRFLVNDKVEARRILLACGLVDELPDLPGLRECWGKSVLHCPYCHAYECRGQRFGFLPRTGAELEFPLLLRGWTEDLTVFANGVPLDDELRRDYASANVRVDERRVLALRAEGRKLQAVVVEGGEVPCDDLFIHPTQTQVPVVAALGLRMFDENSVWVDEHAETSVPGIYAAGDLITPIHNAQLSAAAGVGAAMKLNTALTKAIMRENR